MQNQGAFGFDMDVLLLLTALSTFTSFLLLTVIIVQRRKPELMTGGENIELEVQL